MYSNLFMSKLVKGMSLSSLLLMIALDMVVYLMYRKFDVLDKFKEFNI